MAPIKNIFSSKKTLFKDSKTIVTPDGHTVRIPKVTIKEQSFLKKFNKVLLAIFIVLCFGALLFINAYYLSREKPLKIDDLVLKFINKTEPSENPIKLPSKKPSVSVPNEALIRRDHLTFPFEYTITGIGDTTSNNLSLKFYNDFDHVKLLNYKNLREFEKDWAIGTTIVVPDPNDFVPTDFAFINPEQVVEYGQAISSDGTILASDEEIELFVKVVAAESGANWDYEGVRMIAEVITNRVRKNNSNLYSVISSPDQFTVYETGSFMNATVSDLHRQVVADALKGNQYLPRNVYYFCTDWAYETHSLFKTLTVYTHYDNTYFMSEPNTGPKQPDTEKTNDTNTDFNYDFTNTDITLTEQ